MSGMPIDDADPPPSFDDAFRRRLASLIEWRRDVRRFSDRPVPQWLIDDLLDLAQFSPSVGNSQPWRWVQVASPAKRQQVRTNFVVSNTAACQAQCEERARAYASLKLEGLDQAPFQFAVFCDQTTEQGFGLGRHTMPEMLEYSTVVMIATFWLAARAAGLGVGWVSIVDPAAIGRILETSSTWKLIAYLCVGWPQREHLDPELERQGWQRRTRTGRQVKII